MRGTQRLVAALLTVVVALLLQVTVFPHFAWNGVVPDLVLLAVIGAALVTDPRFATLLGFGAGLLLDLAPPADHAAGRWALALLVVGYVVGRLAHDHSAPQSGGGRPPYSLMLAAGAGGAFVGTSVFALSGVLLSDPAVGVGRLLEVVLTAVAYDTVAALVVLPVTVWIFTREPGPRPAQVTPRAPRRTPV
ncbi:rod shape-determining protein MreD [Nocardioides bizhenqiangii]|uniref:Rod shape-determining protein MreD n=1 Tax=Nocardioides bizhenqiangii TaxID=3095076 RepID=A0ABZ0ZNB3_9ACTN|nr:rod shape-determining protein MreD [Nocardioides sp. HM61]WQQ25446.1 rod shape-determining protein MreD [Nocardioides sp. HM61]